MHNTPYIQYCAHMFSNPGSHSNSALTWAWPTLTRPHTRRTHHRRQPSWRMTSRPMALRARVTAGQMAKAKWSARAKETSDHTHPCRRALNMADANSQPPFRHWTGLFGSRMKPLPSVHHGCRTSGTSCKHSGTDGDRHLSLESPSLA